MESVDALLEDWGREFPQLDARILETLLEARRLGSTLSAFLAGILEPFEIDPGEYELLAALRRVGPPYRSSPSTLALTLELSSGGTSKRVKKLESGGYVSRSPDPEDGRGSLVSLSQRGLDLQERIFRALMAAAGVRLGAIPEARLREITGSLRVLAEALEA